MDSLEFSEDEIKRQLQSLGYFNVSEARMNQFRKDLHKLIEHDRSTSGSSWFNGISSPSQTSESSDFSAFSKPHFHPNRPSAFQPHIQKQTEYEPTMDKPTTAVQPYWVKERESSETTRSDTTPTEALTPSTPEATSNDSSQLSPNLAGKVATKRKVLRKELDGTPRVHNELVMRDSTGSQRSTSYVRAQSFDDLDSRLNLSQKYELPQRCQTARPMSRHSETSSFNDNQQLPSYIRTNNSHPHRRNIVKCDPVNKYQQYKEGWKVNKAPGEKSHHSLRWEVKAQMMIKEEIAPKPQRVYIPNNYVIPTSKKRSALRWQVRHAMVNGTSLPTTYNIY